MVNPGINLQNISDLHALLDADAMTVSGEAATSFRSARKRLRPGGEEGDGSGGAQKCFGCIYSFCKSIQPGSELAMEKLFEYFETNALSMDFDLLVDDVHSLWLSEVYEQECKIGNDCIDWPIEMVRHHLRWHHHSPALRLRLTFNEIDEKRALICDKWENSNEGVLSKTCNLDIAYGKFGLLVLAQLDKLNATKQ